MPSIGTFPAASMPCCLERFSRWQWIATRRSIRTAPAAHEKLGSVLLDIDHEDQQAFAAAREMLLGRFGSWLADERHFAEGEAEDLVGDAGVALEWKWAYGDGELATWRIGDIAEFLLEWCPRKLSVSQAECLTIPLAVASFVSFLDEVTLLGPTSAPVDDELIDSITSLAEGFVIAMGDRSRFGMAKSMFTAATDVGVDMTDPDEAQAWMERFNDRSEESGTGCSPTRPSPTHLVGAACHRWPCPPRTVWPHRGRLPRSWPCSGTSPPMSAPAASSPKRAT